MSRLGEAVSETLGSALWRFERFLGGWQQQVIIADVQQQARECAPEDIAGRAGEARQAADEAAGSALPHYKVMALRHAQHEWERIAATSGSASRQGDLP